MRLRRLLGRVHRAVASPFGRRALERMIGDGLPPRLHEPLRFLFSREVPAAARATVDRIERRRAELAARPDVFRFEYAEGSESVRWRVRAEGPAPGAMTARRMAESVSVTRRWGTFLFLSANAGDGGTILELGAFFGISGAYLASARSAPKLVTLEGSPDLAQIAAETLAIVTDRGTVVQGPFGRTLPQTLARRCPASRPPSTSAASGCSCGKGATSRRKRYDLARYTGWWPLGPARATTLS